MNSPLEPIEEAVSRSNQVLRNFLGRRRARYAIGLLSYALTLLTIIICYSLFNYTEKIIEYTGSQTVFVMDTIRVKDTIFVDQSINLCPACKFHIIESKSNMPFQCPNCKALLIRVKNRICQIKEE